MGTAEAVRQAKHKAVDMDITVTDTNTVTLSLSPSKLASTAAATEPTLPGKAAPGAKGKGAATYAPGTGKRSDLTFLDPMNKADCPPKAIALAAGELVLRMREEKRRREAGGVAADPPLPSRRMSGGKPGKHGILLVLAATLACGALLISCYAALCLSSAPQPLGVGSTAAAASRQRQ